MEWIDKLKKMKAESGLKTKQIAALSGVPEPTLEKLFAGHTADPKLGTVTAVVHSLGFTLDDLAPRASIKKAPESGEPEKEARLDDRMEILLEALARMGYGGDGTEARRLARALAQFLDAWFDADMR